LGRTNIKGKPIDSFEACEDFFVLVVEAHVVAAAMKLLDMEALPQSSMLLKVILPGHARMKRERSC